MALPAIALAGSGPSPKTGSWSGALKVLPGEFGEGIESGKASFKVAKHGKKLVATGSVTMHTACLGATPDPQTGEYPTTAGATETQKFSAPIVNGDESLEKESGAYPHWRVNIDFSSPKKASFGIHWVDSSDCGAGVNGTVKPK
jgi:hypothetical protein